MLAIHSYQIQVNFIGQNDRLIDVDLTDSDSLLTDGYK